MRPNKSSNTGKPVDNVYFTQQAHSKLKTHPTVSYCSCHLGSEDVSASWPQVPHLWYAEEGTPGPVSCAPNLHTAMDGVKLAANHGSSERSALGLAHACKTAIAAQAAPAGVGAAQGKAQLS